LFLAIYVFPQVKEQQDVLFDQFGNISSEDMFARLDNFSQEILKTPNSKGLIRIYRQSEDCFLCGYRRASWIDGILKNTRKFPSEKYSIENCSEIIGDLPIQLYILTTTEKLPDCNKTLEIPDKAYLYDKIYFYFADNKLFALEDEYVDVVGQAHGDYSRAALKAVKNILDKSPESKIYIVVYLGTNKEEIDEHQNGISNEKTNRNLDKQPIARKLIINARNELIKNGIKPLQIKTIDGGYVDDKRKLEFWFVPQGGEVPKPKPDYFPKKKRSKK
jgi:hypothetical protein